MSEYTIRLSDISYIVRLEVEEVKGKHSGDLTWRPVGQTEAPFEHCFDKTGRKKTRFMINMRNGDTLIFHGIPGERIYRDLMAQDCDFTVQKKDSDD